MRELGAELIRQEVEAFEIGPGEVLVEVVGCGICHTDLGFLYDGVRTRHPLPLTLGHEVAGWVVAASDGEASWVGKAVVVPAVMPCGECEACRVGHGNICKAQKMPGNDMHGGFASHLAVPARGLCEVPVRGSGHQATVGDTGLPLAELSVLADAVTTPYQAIERSGLAKGDLAICIGLGGVGGFCAQIAKARGALVLGIEPDPAKREQMKRFCEAGVLDPRDFDEKGLKQEVRALAKAAGARSIERKIYECSGTVPGQASAFSLLDHGATLAVVGFTMGKLELRLSNLMAFDARALGNWGCVPELYPAALQLVLDGAVEISPFVQQFPAASVNELLQKVKAHQIAGRAVLVPGLN